MGLRLAPARLESVDVEKHCRQSLKRGVALFRAALLLNVHGFGLIGIRGPYIVVV